MLALKIQLSVCSFCTMKVLDFDFAPLIFTLISLAVGCTTKCQSLNLDLDVRLCCVMRFMQKRSQPKGQADSEFQFCLCKTECHGIVSVSCTFSTFLRLPLNAQRNKGNTRSEELAHLSFTDLSSVSHTLPVSDAKTFGCFFGRMTRDGAGENQAGVVTMVTTKLHNLFVSTSNFFSFIFLSLSLPSPITLFFQCSVGVTSTWSCDLHAAADG